MNRLSRVLFAGAAAVLMTALAAAPASAFFGHHRKGCESACAPVCCEPAPAPVCCEPAPACAPRQGLFARLCAKKKAAHCCAPAPVCCEPAPAPVCCEPAPAPVCCEPAPAPVCCEAAPEPTCCAPKRKCCGIFRR